MPIAVRMSAERVRHVSMMMMVMAIMMVMAMQVPLGRNGTCISMCATHGGTAGGKECKFPFEYKGETEGTTSKLVIMQRFTFGKPFDLLSQ